MSNILPMGLKHKSTNLVKIIKQILIVLGIVFILLGIGFGINLLIDRKIDKQISTLKEQITISNNFIYNEIESNILRQRDKIISGNFDDIDMVNIIDIFKYYPLLDNPSIEVQLAYSTIIDWYNNR